MLWPDLDQHDPGGLNEQTAQIAIAALRYAAEDRAVAGRQLFRHEPEPCAEVAAFRERIAGADRSLCLDEPTLRSRWRGPQCVRPGGASPPTGLRGCATCGARAHRFASQGCPAIRRAGNAALAAPRFRAPT